MTTSAPYTANQLRIVKTYSAQLTEDCIRRNRARDVFTSIEKGNLGFTPYEMQSPDGLRALTDLLSDVQQFVDLVNRQMEEPLDERERVLFFIERISSDNPERNNTLLLSTIAVGQRTDPIDIELVRANLNVEMSLSSTRCLDVALCGNNDVLALDTILLELAGCVHEDDEDTGSSTVVNKSRCVAGAWGYYPAIIILTLRDEMHETRSLGFISGAHPNGDGSWRLDTYSMAEVGDIDNG